MTTALKPEDADLYNRWMNLREVVGSMKPEVKAGNMTNIDVFYAIKHLIVDVFTTIKYIDKPAKMSPEEQEYYREYREWKVRESELKKYKDLKKEKIARAFQKRKKIYCYGCQDYVQMIDAKAEWLSVKDSETEKLLLVSKCKKCGRTCKAFAGYIRRKHKKL